MNTKMYDLKKIIKELAVKIKETKILFKDHQREHGGYAGEYYRTLYEAQYNYRHKLIAYSLMKGRKYEEIERNCREGNEPNFDLIERIKSEYAAAAEDVCSAA